jgi:hypothetical protein
VRIAGVPVEGSLDRLRDPMLLVGATHVVLALGDKDPVQVERALHLAQETGLVVLSLPEGNDLANVAD